MRLEDLAEQYKLDEELLTRQIDAFREESKSFKGAKKHNANRRLCCLYEMRREVHNTAQILQNYYENKVTKRIYHKKND